MIVYCHISVQTADTHMLEHWDLVNYGEMSVKEVQETWVRDIKKYEEHAGQGASAIITHHSQDPIQMGGHSEKEGSTQEQHLG